MANINTKIRMLIELLLDKTCNNTCTCICEKDGYLCKIIQDDKVIFCYKIARIRYNNYDTYTITIPASEGGNTSDCIIELKTNEVQVADIQNLKKIYECLSEISLREIDTVINSLLSIQ